MTKDAYYFSHDDNARNDNKIIAVRMRYGAEGYGIYFMILEKLRESSGYVLATDYDAIGFDLRVESKKIKSIVEDFGLFVVAEDGSYFYSESFNNRMKPLDNQRNQRSNAGKKSAEKRKSNGNATAVQRSLNESATTVEQNYNKVKEIKVKESRAKKREVNNPPAPLKRGGDFDFSFVREDFKAPFDEWIAYKRSRGQMYKAQRHLRECYSRLEDLSGGDAETAMLIVRQSMANNWAGIFELKNKKNITEIIDRNGNRITVTENGGAVGASNSGNGAHPFRTDAEKRRHEREVLGQMAETILRQP
jgi:hypothetical protein